VAGLVKFAGKVDNIYNLTILPRPIVDTNLLHVDDDSAALTVKSTSISWRVGRTGTARNAQKFGDPDTSLK
jgi:hypothetical protein